MRGMFGEMTYYAESAYYNVTRPFRLSLSRARWVLFRSSLEVCGRCGAAGAQWCHMPMGSEYFRCDDCVPRGCDCNIIEHGIPGKTVIDPPNADGVELIWTDYGDVEPEQHRDDRGRLLPCVDFEFDPHGWPRRKAG